MPSGGCSCTASRPALRSSGYGHVAARGEIFEDTTVAAAILDRLPHHATVLQIDGDSYRMRGHRARLQTLRTALNQPSQGGNFRDHKWGNLVIVDSARSRERRYP